MFVAPAMGEAQGRAGHVPARGVLGLCLLPVSLFAAAQLATPDAAARPAANKATPASGILLTGLPALIELPVTAGDLLPSSWQAPRDICLGFLISNNGPAPARIRLTSTGLLEARFSEGVGPACPQPGVTMLTVAGVDERERRIFLHLPAAAFPDDAGGVKGHVLVLQAGMPPQEIAVQLKRTALSPPVKALIWFWSVFLSALVAALFSLLVYRFNKRADADSEARDELEALLRDDDGSLAKFLRLYPNISSDPQRYRKELEDAMGATRIVASLPAAERERLLTAVRKGDRARVAVVLARTLPRHAAVFSP